MARILPSRGDETAPVPYGSVSSVGLCCLAKKQAQAAGEHTLVFTLEGLMVVGRKEIAIRPPALTVPVEVDVNPMYFVERHWQWLLTAIVIPVAGFFGKRWVDRRSTAPATHG